MNSGAGTAVVESIDPANGELFETYEIFTESAIEEALGVASTSFESWRKTSWGDRSALMSAVASEFRADADDIAKTVSREMGKPITEALAEVEKCAWACDYYAENGEEFLAAEPIDTGDGRRIAVHKRPLGTVLAIMPWNYPLWQAIRAAAPIISAGNVFAMKHASNVTGSGLWLEKVFERAGAAKGVFTTLIVPGSKTAALISDPRVHGVTLTGSDAAGVAVGEAAGREIKPVVLELGGSDPFIVLADADIEKAVEVAVKARFQNTGQSCIAAKRFIVVEGAADAFEEAFAAKAAELHRGSPLDPDTELGPMAREDLRDELAGIVEKSVAAGGRVLTGASAPDEKGAWYEPTVLTGLPEDAPALREETFGPVAAVARVADEAAAIALANDSQFGLGCSLWTTDLDRAEALSADIESGMVFVNAMTASDPRLPFGGVKRSGVGRELGGEFGMRAFLNLQTVAMTE
jgi:succinate-semialdehyde dehydrogenase/glutarate-semialdehyde dehydrogenase